MDDERTSKRMTVTFAPSAASELEWLAAHTGMSQRDVVNRAVRALGAVEREIQDGGELLVSKNGKITRIKII